MTSSPTRVCLLVLCCTASPAALHGASEAADTTPEARQLVRGLIDSRQHPSLKYPRFPHYQDEMRRFYQPRDYALAWIVSGRPRPETDEALRVLLTAHERGLPPEDYDARKLLATRNALSQGARPSARDLALFDTALTLVLFRHLSDVHIGRINPKNLAMGLDIERKKLDLAAVVNRAIADRRIQQVVAQAEPRLPQNERLKAALKRYRQLAHDASLRPPDGNALIRPGARYPAANQLARYLVALGDLDPATASALNPGVYAEPLVAAVKRFQERHNLDADGIIGPATYGALRTPLARRIRQLELALERLRWLPALGSQPCVVVNIPSFRLGAYDLANGAPVRRFDTRVVVGKAAGHQTPVFVSTMRYLDFMPYWNVPASIARQEIAPGLRRDPGYLRARDMELVSGDSVVQTALTPALIEDLERSRVRVRQRPGPKNALGRVKFIFPNSDAVYLHDTPSTTLFARTRRDFSHGCVRVQDPAGLAEFVLRGNPGWDRPRIEAALRGDRTQRVNLDRPALVLLLYSTAAVEPDGRVFFSPDIYGHDTRLEEALRAGEPYPP